MAAAIRWIRANALAMAINSGYIAMLSRRDREELRSAKENLDHARSEDDQGRLRRNPADENANSRGQLKPLVLSARSFVIHLPSRPPICAGALSSDRGRFF